MTAVLSVARKELREAVRDRRSLFSGLIYGVWGPLVMALALTALARDRSGEAPLALAVEGAAASPSLMAFLDERRVNVVGATADPERIRTREAPVALAVGSDYSEDFIAARPAAVTLLFDGSWNESRIKAERVRTLLGEYNRRVADTRLILRGVSPSAVTALEVIERDLSTAAARAGAALATLPIFVLLAAFVGGMGVAADVTAGERERGSLEALLMNPVPRLALVIGKWTTTALAALATIAVTLAVSQAALAHPQVQAIDLPVGLSMSDALRIGVVLTPLALLATAAQVLIALHARTYKEAQTQLSLLMFVPMVPGFLLAFGSLQPADWMMSLPIIGQHILISDIVRGLPPDASSAVGSAVVTLVLAAATLWAAARLLEQERLVRRLS